MNSIAGQFLGNINYSTDPVLMAIRARGITDGLANANTLGLWDAFGGNQGMLRQITNLISG